MTPALPPPLPSPPTPPLFSPPPPPPSSPPFSLPDSCLANFQQAMTRMADEADNGPSTKIAPSTEKQAAFTEIDDGFGTRIVGGTPVGARERPFLVSLQTDYGSHFCGGSLIAPNWILTAAHCTQSSPGLVRVGLHRLSDSSNECVQTRAVLQTINHPFYNTDTLANDISLLQLSSAVDYPPVTLNSAELLEQAASMLTVAGWGTTSMGGSLARSPMQVDVPVVSNDACKTAYGGGIIPSMMCAGYSRGGKDSCQGDSGGPLFGGSGGETKLVGIVSWGNGCALEGYPGVYTRASSFNQWVCDTTGQAAGCAAAPPPGVGTSPPVAPPPPPVPVIDSAAWEDAANLAPLRPFAYEADAAFLQRCMAACAVADSGCVGFSQSSDRLCEGAQCCHFHDATSTYFEPGDGMYVLNNRGSSRARAFGAEEEEAGVSSQSIEDHFSDSTSLAITGVAFAVALILGTCLGYLFGSGRLGCCCKQSVTPSPPPRYPGQTLEAGFSGKPVQPWETLAGYSPAAAPEILASTKF